MFAYLWSLLLKRSGYVKEARHSRLWHCSQPQFLVQSAQFCFHVTHWMFLKIMFEKESPMSRKRLPTCVQVGDKAQVESAGSGPYWWTSVRAGGWVLEDKMDETRQGLALPAAPDNRLSKAKASNSPWRPRELLGGRTRKSPLWRTKSSVAWGLMETKWLQVKMLVKATKQTHLY